MHAFTKVAVSGVYRNEIVQGLLHTNKYHWGLANGSSNREGCDETSQKGKFYFRMKPGRFLVFS